VWQRPSKLSRRVRHRLEFAVQGRPYCRTFRFGFWDGTLMLTAACTEPTEQRSADMTMEARVPELISEPEAAVTIRHATHAEAARLYAGDESRGS
jgi:hypothetical protein